MAENIWSTLPYKRTEVLSTEALAEQSKNWSPTYKSHIEQLAVLHTPPPPTSTQASTFKPTDPYWLYGNYEHAGKTVQSSDIAATASESALSVKKLIPTASYALCHPSHSYQTTWMPFCVTCIWFITMVVNITNRYKVLQLSTPTELRKESEPPKTYYLCLKAATNQISILYNCCIIPPP